jgi:urea transport system ATP-binding protein
VRQASYYYAMQRGGIVASGPISGLSDSIVREFLTV